MNLRAILRRSTPVVNSPSLTARLRSSFALPTRTLIITSLDGAVRPPRKVAFALALFVSGLATPHAPPTKASSLGKALFDTHCSGCHERARSASSTKPAKMLASPACVYASR